MADERDTEALPQPSPSPPLSERPAPDRPDAATYRDISDADAEALMTSELEASGLPAGPNDNRHEMAGFRAGSHTRAEVEVAIEERRDEVAARRRDEPSVANDNAIEPTPELMDLHEERAAAQRGAGGRQEPADDRAGPEEREAPDEATAGPGEAQGEQETAEHRRRRFSVDRGDVPEDLKDRYLVEEGRRFEFYKGHKDAEATFQDAGKRLHTESESKAVIADMVEIAKHRGWEEIQVKGTKEFRQEAWLEARAAGLDVRGYKPNELDLQELDRRREPGRNTVTPVEREAGAETVGRDRAVAETVGRDRPVDAQSPREGRPAPEKDRVDLREGVTGRLVEVGSAPYLDKAGERATPFLKVELESGRQEKVWGADIPDALARSGKSVGDDITIRKEAVRQVEVNVPRRDPETGDVAFEKQTVNRNTFAVETAERFKALSPAERAADPELRNAQSQLSALTRTINERVKDPEQAATLTAKVEEAVADRLAQGSKFEPAKVQDVERVQSRESAAPVQERPARELAPARSAPERER